MDLKFHWKDRRQHIHLTNIDPARLIQVSSAGGKGVPPMSVCSCLSPSATSVLSALVAVLIKGVATEVVSWNVQSYLISVFVSCGECHGVRR